MYKTKFDIVENKIKETKKGQKEVWTAKNGPKNILFLRTIINII